MTAVTAVSAVSGPDKDRLHVRAVRYTSHPDAWRPLIEALGGTAGAGPGEIVVALGAGSLVLQDASADGVVTAIELGAPDAVDAVDAVMAGDVAVARSVPAPTPATSGSVTVCPLWMTGEVPGAVAALRSAGLVVRLASNAGRWVDLSAPAGGLVAVHAEDPPDPATAPHAVLAFEAGDVAALAERFERRGLRADVVDESYGRSLRIDDPDGGIELWVNETMTDLYGYRRSGA